MNPRLPLIALIASIPAVVVALPALAADPETGEVSAASPKIQWTGTAGGYGVSIVADINGQFPNCSAPFCDEFTLSVKDQADLTVAITTDDGTGFTTIEVEGPDGTITYNGGADGESTSTIKLKKAAPGPYLVRTMTNNPPAQGDAYTGSATLAVAGAPAPGASPAPTPGGGQTPPPSSGQQPQQSEPATISVKTGKLSARKLKRKLSLRLHSTGPVSALKGTLRKGSRTVGSGKLARLDGNGKMSLKLGRKLKKGTYALRVAGRSANGSVVSTTVKLKVAR